MDLVHYLQQLGSDYQELIFDCSRMFYKESRQLVLELFVNYHPVDGGSPSTARPFASTCTICPRATSS